MAEYKILVIFVVVLFVLIGFGISWVTAVCFVIGALFSTVAGYCGMTVATKANVRTANAAKESGMNKALSIAFSGGAVMGMCVAGLGALGVSLVYISFAEGIKKTINWYLNHQEWWRPIVEKEMKIKC